MKQLQCFLAIGTITVEGTISGYVFYVLSNYVNMEEQVREVVTSSCTRM